MSRALLDVNVLLALLDSDHVDHRRARTWLEANIEGGWASCAVTQNGFVRVISQPRYPSPVPPAAAIGLLDRACAQPYHEYWSCDLSLLDADTFDRTRIHGPRQVTDSYLLALATRHRGTFVSFDRSVVLTSVPAAKSHNLTIL